MHPGPLVTNVGHLKKVLVQASLFDGFLESWFMRARRARGHHYPVQVVLFDALLNQFLGILGTSE